MEFKEVALKDIELKPFEKIADEWMLISAGVENNFNTMTASWGFLGEMWAKKTAICVIRPQRHTLKFCNDNDYFTLSFFGKGYRKELGICGSKSGRDVDKMQETGFVPHFFEGGVFYEQSELTLLCKKLYIGQISPDCFVDKSICNEVYPNNDYHFTFVGEVVKAYKTEK